MEANARSYAWRWYLGLAVAPILLLQGLWVRARTPRLPDASGPSSGSETVIEEQAIREKSLRLAVIGESPVAGVGVDCQRDGLACQLAKALAAQNSCTVDWASHGVTGSVAREWGDWLLTDSVGVVSGAEVVVVVLGVNDTTGLSSRTAWRTALKTIVSSLPRDSIRTLVFTSVPPVGQFSALSLPLRSWLGARSVMLDHDLASVVQSFQRSESTCHISHLSALPELSSDLLATDGFHPSAHGYREWAGALAQHLAAIDLLK